MRGATVAEIENCWIRRNFYSHAPCGARPTAAFAAANLQKISTHTPHAGRDSIGSVTGSGTPYFYSHAPCGARRLQHCRNHAKLDFYSHAPCGARLNSSTACCSSSVFLLTRPMRGATYAEIWNEWFRDISTHTPHAGRDVRPGYNLGDVFRISTHTPHAGRDQ